MSYTASYVKDRFNTKAYDRYTFYLRKDKDDNKERILNDRLKADREENKKSTGDIVKEALFLYYDDLPKRTARKSSEPAPEYKELRQCRTAVKKIIAQLEAIKKSEELKRENTPNNLKESATYEEREERIVTLEEAIEALEAY